MSTLEEIELAEWRKTPTFYRRLVDELYRKTRASRGSYLFIPLADAYANLGEVDDAIAVLRGGLVTHPSSRAAKVLLAQLLYDREEVAESRRLLEEVVARWPDVPAAVALLAKIVSREGDVDTPVALTERLSASYPDSRYVHRLVAHYARLKAEATAAVAEEVVPPAPAQEGPPPGREVAVGPLVELNLTPAMIAPDDEEPSDEIEPLVIGGDVDDEELGDTSVILPEPGLGDTSVILPEPDDAPSSGGRKRNRGRKAPEGQMTLFKLETMLGAISRLKDEHDDEKGA
jgi:hypothetical protein